MVKQNIYDLDKDDLESWLTESGEPRFRKSQLLDGLYKKLYDDFFQFAALPNPLRETLRNSFEINPLIPTLTQKSKDGLTEKSLLELRDGQAVETVLMRYEKRNSLCISTQVGCAMDCVFCATGQMGFKRQLSSGEILGQIIYYQRRLREEGETLTNIVYMGMGEPFLNYEQTMKSIKCLTDSDCLGFGSRRITVSTVGIIPKIARFAEDTPQVNLAVSLHSADSNLRSQLVPANRIYPLDALIKACQMYIIKTHRRVTFEYALIEEVNDSTQAARELANLLSGMLCHVNLIALNPSSKYPLRGSSRERVTAFQEELIRQGIPTTVRLRRGIEINAGCGQLASSHNSE